MAKKSQSNLMRKSQVQDERLAKKELERKRLGALPRRVAPRKRDREKAEQDAGRGEEGAAAAEEAVKRWAGVFAHELNQPLAAMLTTAQACRSLLATGRFLANEMAQGMDALVRRIQHTAEVVRCLRTLAGGEPPRRLPADLREVVRRSLDLLQGPLADIGATVTFDFADGLPTVKIDAVQIVQVVVNLARNAIEAMSNVSAPRRQLTVRAQFNSREAIVAVEDQGVGLSVDAVRRLFQPFASTKAAGMGLGLALCRQIVEAHGGRIWAKGNTPNGCVFSFSVPLETEEP
jgi:two-component system sensor kinase FixL